MPEDSESTQHIHLILNKVKVDKQTITCRLERQTDHLCRSNTEFYCFSYVSKIV